jgi:hypothetical protein
MNNTLWVITVMFLYYVYFIKPAPTNLFPASQIVTKECESNQKSYIPHQEPVLEKKLEQKPVPEKFNLFTESLNLELVEITNPLIWSEGSPEFSGYLYIEDGEIQEINIKIMDHVDVSIFGAEMHGNSFKYYQNNEEMHGLIYQVDQYSYMMNFADGTQLKFKKTQEQIEAEEIIRMGSSVDTNALQH